MEVLGKAMTAPAITVLITTYNYGRFLEQAIDSVLSQDFPSEKLEVVVVDDGSTDDTADRVRRYGQRISYFPKQNGGQASALNLGFEKARGEIVALLDADDFFLPGKLASIATAFDRHPNAGMVYHPYEEWDTRTNERRISQFPLVSGDVWANPDRFAYYRSHPTSCISFRRRVLDRLLPIPEQIRMAADAYPANLVPFISPIIALPSPLVVYRVHGTNSAPCFENTFHGNDSAMPSENRKNRLQMYETVIEAMRSWLSVSLFTSKQAQARNFLDRWTFFQQEEQLKVYPPGRLEYFSFLIRRNFLYRSQQTWKFTLFNYLTAFSALVLSHEKAQALQTRTLKRTERLRRKSTG